MSSMLPNHDISFSLSPGNLPIHGILDDGEVRQLHPVHDDHHHDNDDHDKEDDDGESVQGQRIQGAIYIFFEVVVLCKLTNQVIKKVL